MTKATTKTERVVKPMESTEGVIHRPKPHIEAFGASNRKVDADDAAGNEWRGRRHNPGARDEVIGLPSGAGPLRRRPPAPRRHPGSGEP